MPLLWYRLLRAGGLSGWSGRGDSGRSRCTGQPWPQLHQGLLPLQNHVWPGSPDPADAADEERPVRQGWRLRPHQLGSGVRHHGREIQGDPEREGPNCCRHVRLRPVDRLGRLCRRQADEGRLPHQQHRPQCPSLHGLGGRWLHAYLRHGRADGLLRRYRAGRCVRAVGLQHGRDAPILWSRMSDRRLSNPDVQVHVLSTFEHRSFELADNGMVFTRRPIWQSSTMSPTTSSRTTK